MKQLSKISDLNLKGKNILIVGKPASGKTFISKILKKEFKNHEVLHSDDFIQLENQLKEKLSNIVQQKRNYILEGNQAYLVFKWLDKSLYPDIILEISVTDEQVKKIYEKERVMNKMGFALAFYHHYKSELSKFLSKNRIEITHFLFKNNF
jgi:uridine kinase